MNKVLLGLLLGAVLGVFDGATAWFTPEVRNDMLGIIIGSTLKGVIAGVAAGIFARKVQSTAAGVVFGLAVGLLLAWLVAWLGGGKYYFEIMLPGGVVGAILGWATQRYGRPAAARGAMATAALFVFVLCGTSASADVAAFEKIKGLAGTHKAHMLKPDGALTEIEYRVTANGTAVIETMFRGEPHEMVTVYTVDGDSIVATHYCSGGNQPTMKLNTAKSTANELVFDFVNVTGNVGKSHINGVSFVFKDDGHVEEIWSSKGAGEHLRLFYRK
ncbi:MAG TPA: hypothetical protein VHK90_02905 [Thermoanaerobaculia bacterium]|nr:hypothetical protein [Thermoanaerobaculia bacterium]